MANAVECFHMNHINALVEDFASVGRFQELYGAQFNLDLPGEHWHACLATIGGVMFEFFAPTQYLLHARFGPYYVGVEYQVPDVDAARKAAARRGLRVVRELGNAFHTHPADAFGVAWEFFDRSFQDPESPPAAYVEPIGTPEFWSRHPIGYLGLKRYSLTVADTDAATQFLEGFLGARFLYDEERPLVGARAIGLCLGDTVVELLSPVGPGPIERALARYGDGIRSTVFAVRDLGRTERYLADQGIRFGPGDGPDSIAVHPEDNAGLLFEFAE
jgi:catechol 2,3-dioxygenase-like lactoylglutathione lyase family enzyme/uncharacterized glyoxalase superfamily protein PhnB